MGCGSHLIDRVHAALSPDVAKFPKDIRADIGEPVPSLRAVRYAVTALVGQKKARRKGWCGSVLAGGWAPDRSGVGLSSQSRGIP